MSSSESALEVLRVGGGLKKRLSQFSYLNVRDVWLHFGSLLTHTVVNVFIFVNFIIS